MVKMIYSLFKQVEWCCSMLGLLNYLVISCEHCYN